MKKLLIVLVVFFLVLSQLQPQNEFSLLNYFSGEYLAYSSAKQDDLNYFYCGANISSSNAKITAETMILYNFEVASAIKTLNARVINTEYLESGVVIVYAYSSLIGEKQHSLNYNLQLAIKDEVVVIGWPRIVDDNLIKIN